MRLDRRGDLGFGEAILATIAVVVVFNAFFAVSLAHVSDETHAEGFDTGMLGGEMIDGQFVPSFHDRLLGFLSTTDVSGVQVNTVFPGNHHPDHSIAVGESSDIMQTYRLCDTLDTDQGWTVPVVYEVTVCR